MSQEMIRLELDNVRIMAEEILDIIGDYPYKERPPLWLVESIEVRERSIRKSLLRLYKFHKILSEM